MTSTLHARDFFSAEGGIISINLCTEPVVLLVAKLICAKAILLRLQKREARIEIRAVLIQYPMKNRSKDSLKTVLVAQLL